MTPTPPSSTSVDVETLTYTRWANNEPKHTTIPAHGSSVVTALLLSYGQIIAASDDNSISVHSLEGGKLEYKLVGHNGGVWALAATKDLIISGSTDQTVRVWDRKTGQCKHIFGGHASTVRCLTLVKPEVIDVEGDDGVTRKERWPKRDLIVTGSRDHSLRIWTLPRPEDPGYKTKFNEDGDISDDNVSNPYLRHHLEGHEHAVREISARGRIAVSGSYDCTVRVWDIINGVCKWTLQGHTQKVYSVVLDLARNQAYSGSMDGTVRVWNLQTGACQHTLTGHTSLVGLVGLSSSHLVSAAADSTIRVWNPETGDLQHTLAAHTGAITCFQHDEFKVLSGSDGNFKMWNIRDGTVVRDLLTGITGVWQVVFEGSWCVAAVNRQGATSIDIWDFGEVENEHVDCADEDPTEGEDDDEETNKLIRDFANKWC
ncbi:cell division control protein 4 [Coprinopsis cinerea okayama7|uniref:Cell division control protein 4 n=1 Tax=Coprinopsis cinerea (strain Okayama-7 / 130 / ATCC MYA-4618 / FGSC 9003) TaxID=240176 RepID=D6RKW2_COPC7|nr:cell division control protein 4 [Coprinopsis cinerea okayama7\|eukprot:XP_002911825.1 cell division control protein 4 [Coprinopsis cinerea okayama7\